MVSKSLFKQMMLLRSEILSKDLRTLQWRLEKLFILNHNHQNQLSNNNIRIRKEAQRTKKKKRNDDDDDFTFCLKS